MIEPLSIGLIAVCSAVLAVLLAVLGQQVSVKTGWFSLSFSNNKDRFNKIIELTKKYILDRVTAENNILSSQMKYAELVISDICDTIQADRHVYEVIKMQFKACLLENHLKEKTPEEFSRYVGVNIDAIRDSLKKFKPHNYLDTPQFSDKVGEMFNHALACTSHWSECIIKLDSKYDEEIKELTRS